MGRGSGDCCVGRRLYVQIAVRKEQGNVDDRAPHTSTTHGRETLGERCVRLCGWDGMGVFMSIAASRLPQHSSLATGSWHSHCPAAFVRRRKMRAVLGPLLVACHASVAAVCGGRCVGVHARHGTQRNIAFILIARSACFECAVGSAVDGVFVATRRVLCSPVSSWAWNGWSQRNPRYGRIGWADWITRTRA